MERFVPLLQDQLELVGWGSDFILVNSSLNPHCRAGRMLTSKVRGPLQAPTSRDPANSAAGSSAVAASAGGLSRGRGQHARPLPGWNLALFRGLSGQEPVDTPACLGSAKA